jgi:hypothetical protein
MAALIPIEAVEFDQISVSEFANAFRVGEKLDACDTLVSELLQWFRIARPQKSVDCDQML